MGGHSFGDTLESTLLRGILFEVRYISGCVHFLGGVQFKDGSISVRESNLGLGPFWDGISFWGWDTFRGEIPYWSADHFLVGPRLGGLHFGQFGYFCLGSILDRSPLWDGS